MNHANQNGSAIIMILVAVALFAALAYAFSQGSRSNLSLIQGEMQEANSVKDQQCGAAISTATKRLTLRGCKAISTETNMALVTDPNCAIFHTSGGGISPCTIATTPIAPCTSTVIGAVCPDGAIYAGISPDGNKRMYATPNDAGFFAWNNSSSSWFNTSMTDCGGSGGSCRTGASNTTLLAGLSGTGAPYAAAIYCNSLTANNHDDWYLPAIEELLVLGDNAAAIGNFDLTGDWTDGYYWSSSESTNQAAWVSQLSTNFPHTRPKNIDFRIRCVRKD